MKEVFMQVLQLIQDTEGWMYRQGFSRSTITLGYRPHWNKFRRLVGEGTDFSKCNLSQSVKSIYGKDIFSTDPYRLSKTESNARKAFCALREFNSSGRVSRRPRSGVSIEKPLTAESSRILNGYEGHLLGCGLTEATIRNNLQVIRRFLAECPAEDITRENVLGYVNGFGKYRRLTAATYRNVLQRFFACCSENEGLPMDIQECFLPYKKRQGAEIATVYTPEELSLLLKYVSSHGKTPARNYALVLLIAVFGLRAKDISDLTLSSIDWEKGTLRIVQSKNQKALEHKLTDLTANALAHYLLDERPESEDIHVFLKQDGTKLADRSVSPMVAYAFISSGIELKGRKHGSHSIRHSLASNMLAADVDILTISKVLGHSSVTTTKAYAKVDIPHLRLVGLEVPDYE